MISMVMGGMAIVAVLIYLPNSDKDKDQDAKAGKRKESTARSAAATKANEAQTGDGQLFDLADVVDKIRLRNEKRDIAFVKDPFKKLEPQLTALSFSDLVLSGLGWEKDTPTAIINDQFLKKGDQISGFIVVEIRQDEVILYKDLQRYVLKFTAQNQSE